MDPTIYNARDKRTCRGCNWDAWLTLDDPPPHTCSSAPAVPRSVLEDRRAAAYAAFAKRELAIREARMAEITMAQVRRGRA